MSRVYSRVNGWTPPPHPLQALAWIMVLYLTASTFGILAPSFDSATVRITVYAVMGTLIFINITANIIVTTIDPSDDAVKKKIRNNPRPGFDRGKHRHVIDENYFCNICETIIQPSSKHCRQCNKCVLNFDHHCKWLNNCIGTKNYKWFLFYVITAVITSLCILALSLCLFVLQFVDREDLYLQNGSLMVFGCETKDAIWLVFVGLTLLVASGATVLLMHLLIFHLRIIKKGMTTYNYIMEQRKKEEEEKRKAESAALASANGKGDVRLFSQTKIANDVMANGSHPKHAQNGAVDYGRLSKLKLLLQMRKARSQNGSHKHSANLALATLSQNGQNTGPQIHRKSIPKDDLVMVDHHSSDNMKIDDRKDQSKSNDRRPITPLPPIVTSVRKPQSIASFVNAPNLASIPETAARRKRRKKASAQSPVPYEIMEDKENRVSVSHIAASVNSESSNMRRMDSANFNAAYSRHADVPRLPPLAATSNSSALLVPANTRPVSESILLRTVLSGEDLALSLRSNISGERSDDVLREIPLTSFVQKISAQKSAQRASSGSSSGSSGSILAPLQVDALSRSANANLLISGRHIGPNHNQRIRNLPPLMPNGGRYPEILLPMQSDYDTGSMSSGSKRVRFNAESPAMKRTLV